MRISSSFYRTSVLTGIVISASVMLYAGVANANPQDGVVTAGGATITSNGNKLDIHQSTNKAVIDWRTFDIDAGEHTQFYQPSSSSLALNRVNTGGPSQIFGTLTANGNVMIVNSSGILFGAGSKVDVNGMVATTSDINNSDFMAGKLNFATPGNPNASVINEGSITAKDAGLIGLVAPNVSNSGVITAKLGKAQLASGDSFTVDMYGDGLLNIKVSDDVTSQLVKNTGSIEANEIKLTAAAGSEIVNSLIDVKGELKAPSVAEKDGKIIIFAEGSNAVQNNASEKGKKTGVSTVLVDGKLTAKEVEILGDHVGLLGNTEINADGGKVKIGGALRGEGNTPTAKNTTVHKGAVINAKDGEVVVWADNNTEFHGDIFALGGDVETSGKNTLSVSGSVNAATWLLDPNNITIQAAGSNTNTTGSATIVSTNDNAIVTTKSIQDALNAGVNVTVQTGSGGSNSQLGDINVNSSILKDQGTDATLTLKAANSIILASNTTISSTSNKLNITINADSSPGAGAVVLNQGSALISNGGNIVIGGSTNPATISAIGTSANKPGIELNGATISSGAGNVTLNGKGYGTASNNFGIYLHDGAEIKSTTGNITLNGTGGAGTNTNHGVYSTSGTNKITTSGGSVTINGTGGGTGNTNYGVNLQNITIKTDNAGVVSITGNAANGTTGTNRGAYVGATIETKNGDISITGNGNGTGGLATGVYLAAADIKSTGTGKLDITGNGTTKTSSGNTNYGVYLYNGTLLETNSGNLTVTGNGATGGADNNYGIYASTGISQIKSGNGNITLNGEGGGAGANNMGVRLNNSRVTSTGSGKIDISGYGSTYTGGQTNAHGVYLYNGTILTTNTNDIIIHGYGGNDGYAGDTNYGIFTGSGPNKVTSTSGDISLTGYGGNGTSGNNYGNYLSNDTFSTAGAGEITIIGTGGSSAGGKNRGTFASSTISTEDGDITIQGIGHGTGDDNSGVSLSSANIYSSGEGSINITGTATTSDSSGTTKNHGVWIFNGTSIDTKTGDIAFTGTKTSASTASADIYAYTNGPAGTNVIGNTTESGDVIFNANSLVMTDSQIKTASDKAVYFIPRTTGTVINVNGGTGGLELNSTIIDSITAGTVVIGRNDGTADINLAGDVWNSNLTLRNGSGNIVMTGTNDVSGNEFNATTSNGGNITLGTNTAKTIFAETSGGNPGDIIISGVQTATDTGTAMTLVAGKNIVNNAGNSLVATNGRWLAYSTNVTGTTGEVDLDNDFNRYGCTYSGGCAAGITLPTSGNGLIYSYTPMLNVTPNNVNVTYGSNLSSLNGYAYTVSGYNTGEFADNVTGSLNGSSNYTLGSGVGNYQLNYTSGSLASELGYRFNYLNNATGVTVNPAVITVTANPEVIAANKLPNFTASYSGFVLGQNASILTSQASFTDTAPDYSTQGSYMVTPYGVSVNSNYTVSYNSGSFIIGLPIPDTVNFVSQAPQTTIVQNNVVQTMIEPKTDTSNIAPPVVLSSANDNSYAPVSVIGEILYADPDLKDLLNL